MATSDRTFKIGARYITARKGKREPTKTPNLTGRKQQNLRERTYIDIDELKFTEVLQ
jgi:hypothetical protein